MLFKKKEYAFQKRKEENLNIFDCVMHLHYLLRRLLLFKIKIKDVVAFKIFGFNNLGF